MKEKIVTARKDHECDYCGGPIKKGSKYIFKKGKYPSYDENDNQNGIYYNQSRTHVDGECDLLKLYDNFEKVCINEQFICTTCQEHSDDPNEYTYPISELANPWEDDPTLLICKECAEGERLDKIKEKYDEEI